MECLKDMKILLNLRISISTAQRNIFSKENGHTGDPFKFSFKNKENHKKEDFTKSQLYMICYINVYL